MKQRITISLDEDQAAKFDQLIAERGYENRSEAFRDLIRAAEASQTLSDPPSGATCVAVVSYVYNHHERQLSMRLTQEQHEHGDLVISQMHAHLGQGLHGGRFSQGHRGRSSGFCRQTDCRTWYSAWEHQHHSCACSHALSKVLCKTKKVRYRRLLTD